MHKKGFLIAILVLLLLGGCSGRAQSEEKVLPTMDPAVGAQKDDVTDRKDDITGQKGSAADAGGKEENEKKTFGGLYYDFMPYVDSSKQAIDQNYANTLESVVTVACVEAQLQGMVFPKEPIRFRYTKELEGLDDSYLLLKQAILEIMEDNAIELKGEGNYLMVEISGVENGTPEVKVELLQE